MSNTNTIDQYFSNGSSKKRDLSDASKEGEVPKQVREGSLDDTAMSDEASSNVEVFRDDNQISATLSSLQQCLLNVQQEVRDIRRISESTQHSQIKGEEQLTELTKNIKYINEKFKEFEEERKADKETIKKLQQNLSVMNKRLDDMDKELDKHEQYSRRNCILIHGIPEKKDEDTDKEILKVINDNIDENVNITDIDRSHRIGKFNSSN